MNSTLKNIRRLNELRDRLRNALHNTATLPALREDVINILSDLGSGLRTLDPVVDECAITERSPVHDDTPRRDTEPDSAPAVSVDGQTDWLALGGRS
jgi:hypothetical protein